MCNLQPYLYDRKTMSVHSDYTEILNQTEFYLNFSKQLRSCRVFEVSFWKVMTCLETSEFCGKLNQMCPWPDCCEQLLKITHGWSPFWLPKLLKCYVFNICNVKSTTVTCHCKLVASCQHNSHNLYFRTLLTLWFYSKSDLNFGKPDQLGRLPQWVSKAEVSTDIPRFVQI